VITLSVGGNDLLRILGAPNQAPEILAQFQTNLVQILCGLPQSRVYIQNLYDIPEITAVVPGGLEAILTFNAIVAGVADACGASVADVFSAFSGQTGLLLVERNGADQVEVHPTNAGYHAITAAFEAVHQ